MKVHPQDVVLSFNEDTICRICLDKGDPNDLITPCACSGTMAHVHEKCLRTWIETKKVPIRRYRCEQCLNNLVVYKKHPEETFRLKMVYKNKVVYVIEYLFYLCVGFSSSLVISEIEKLNNYSSVRLLDNNNNSTILYTLVSDINVNPDFYIFYYLGFTGYLFSFIFYFINTIRTILFVKRKMLFFRLNFLNLFLTYLLSSHFWLFYFSIFYFQPSNISADLFVCMSCFFTLFNLPLARIYCYFYNNNLVLMNEKYNIIKIQNVQYNPLTSRLRRLNIC